MDEIYKNIYAYLIKDDNSPMSSSTHLNQALFAVIETMSDEDLDIVYQNYGTGYDAIQEIIILDKIVGKPINPRYNKFLPSKRD